MKNDWLLDYRKDVTSQTGEDGIIDKVFEIIGTQSKWCVEFGAYDGKFCSNTYNLINRGGYSAVLIEPSKGRYKALEKNYADKPNVVLLNSFIDIEGANSLDNILSRTPIPTEFDLLVIDIDGNDYHIWQSLEKYHPRVVIIEFNSTIPLNLEIVQPKEKIHDCGASLLAVYNLGKQKGYQLVCISGDNAIFVEEKNFALFNIDNNHPSELWKEFESKSITQIYQKCDGTLVITGNDRLNWHGVKIKQSAIQVLPKFLRFFPGLDNFWTRMIKRLYYKVFRLGSMNRDVL